MTNFCRFITVLAVLVTLVLPVPHARAQQSAAVDALMIAVMSDDARGVEAALASGADIDADTGEGRTPLIAAAMSTRPAMVALLLEKGADPDRQADDPAIGNAVTAAFFAMNGVQLTGQVDEPDPAMRAAALEVLRQIARHEPDLNVLVRRATTNLSALMIAAQAGALDAVTILLDAGADPSVVNGGRYTALDYAVERAPVWATAPIADRAAIVRLLVARGARTDHRGADGLTVVERAHRSGQPAIEAALNREGH